jgi:hypothetical protein
MNSSASIPLPVAIRLVGNETPRSFATEAFTPCRWEATRQIEGYRVSLAASKECWCASVQVCT